MQQILCFIILPILILIIGVISLYDFKGKKIVIFITAFSTVYLTVLKGCNDISDSHSLKNSEIKKEQERKADSIDIKNISDTLKLLRSDFKKVEDSLKKCQIINIDKRKSQFQVEGNKFNAPSLFGDGGIQNN